MLTVIIPAYNEEEAIGQTIDSVKSVLSQVGIEHEILVVDDGSTDRTALSAGSRGARVITHLQNLGYGRSLKNGIWNARYDLVAILDADGTYPIDRLPEMIKRAEKFDMVVGARTGSEYSGRLSKRLGRFLFKVLSEFTTGRRIPDINSGFRVFRRSNVIRFFPYISSGFSFTTTVTLVYMLNDYFVDYIPISYRERSGHSKVHYFRDTLRATQIIVEVILRYNPIKIFLLLSLPFFLASLIFTILSFRFGSWQVALLGLCAMSSGAIILGLGFLAVLLHERELRMTEDKNSKL